jgi:hypothetical protein
MLNALRLIWQGKDKEVVNDAKQREVDYFTLFEAQKVLALKRNEHRQVAALKS